MNFGYHSLTYTASYKRKKEESPRFWNGNARLCGTIQAQATGLVVMCTRTPLFSAILNETLHTFKAKNGRNYVILIALFGLFSQGALKE